MKNGFLTLFIAVLIIFAAACSDDMLVDESSDSAAIGEVQDFDTALGKKSSKKSSKKDGPPDPPSPPDPDPVPDPDPDPVPRADCPCWTSGGLSESTFISLFDGGDTIVLEADFTAAPEDQHFAGLFYPFSPPPWFSSSAPWWSSSDRPLHV